MEHGVRSTKLKLIYKKAIQISLNHKNEITKLIQETTPLDSCLHFRYLKINYFKRRLEHYCLPETEFTSKRTQWLI
ncbi:hypothetical protein NBO_33g0010 [Nosema bombycis CQ1]|uniref:Uncharacterized protein n=1 Tax=Nosema bombycis (strain CQ1 / CVCC 102059) TaxID=578461 RepID=R0M888_NOSB1|nr:hypothetical protein NBO_33g0010 [Nosema bombycis CQ1]|eukprot:EOB14204.1 hypothetical protein NBO_33g0010 [Nosema bombycis CQ1]